MPICKKIENRNTKIVINIKIIKFGFGHKVLKQKPIELIGNFFSKANGPFSPGLFKGMVKAGASAVKVRSELVKGGPATDYDLDESMMSLEDLEVHYFWRYF